MRWLILLAALSLSGCGGIYAADVRRDPPAAPVTVKAQAPGAGTLTIRRIAHSSLLLEAGEVRVLTDPWFTEDTGYHHGEPLAMDVAGLPALTAVVASHGHYDHYDIEGFKTYRDKSVPFIVRKGSGEKATAAGFTDVREVEPWQATELQGVRITATPGAHGVPENSYVVELGGYTVFFGGDTRKIPELDQIPGKFPRIDVALMPVNGLWVTVAGQQVMNAEEAADVVALLKPQVAVPIHYAFHGNGFTDTFILHYDGTPERFAAAVKKVAPATQVIVLAPGDPLVLAP